MHTSLGVPGLSGYPTIHYFVPALIKHRCWGGPIGISANLDIGEGGGGAWAPVRRVSLSEWALFQAVDTMALWPRRAHCLVACPFTPEEGGGLRGSGDHVFTIVSVVVAGFGGRGVHIC
jgi:hypothetical protein